MKKKISFLASRICLMSIGVLIACVSGAEDLHIGVLDESAKEFSGHALSESVESWAAYAPLQLQGRSANQGIVWKLSTILQSLDISSDRKIWAFTAKDGLSFPNGALIRAEDFVISLNACFADAAEDSVSSSIKVRAREEDFAGPLHFEVLQQRSPTQVDEDRLVQILGSCAIRQQTVERFRRSWADGLINPVFLSSYLLAPGSRKNEILLHQTVIYSEEERSAPSTIFVRGYSSAREGLRDLRRGRLDALFTFEGRFQDELQKDEFVFQWHCPFAKKRLFGSVLTRRGIPVPCIAATSLLSAGH